MMDYSSRNKKAWEYNAYDFWLMKEGPPSEKAVKIRENPVGMLKKYATYFDTYEGITAADICGSCGKKAVPLAVLGADMTIFDISGTTGGMRWNWQKLLQYLMNIRPGIFQMYQESLQSLQSGGANDEKSKNNGSSKGILSGFCRRILNGRQGGWSLRPDECG